MKHYDFILFENYKLAKHHLYDVELIARMLQNQGLDVAIFDIFHQYNNNIVGNIPIIHWQPFCNIPNDDWMLRKHSKWETIRKSFRFMWQQKRYMRAAKAFIENMADNFYCGSYHNGMCTVFFDIKKPCYWWGLRSERLKFSWRKLFQSPLLGFNILRERRAFLRNPQQRLFVSNHIIMEEYERLGVPRNRMVIREERCIEVIKTPDLKEQTANISFLVIGMLRPEKHIPTTISAFKKANIVNSTLKLVGRSSHIYEEMIKKSIDGDDRIIRTNAFLNYSDFYRAFNETHFVLFADEESSSCITNGTFMEALINYRPVICPNYNPYKYYIDKYQVGLIYERNNLQSYSNALKKASELGTIHFIPAINRFLSTILFAKVSKELVKSIKKIDNENKL